MTAAQSLSSTAKAPVSAKNGAGEGGPAVYVAIASVMARMAKEGISKDRRSGDGGGPKFSFRGIDDVYNALAPVMAEAGLMMLPRMIARDVTERQTRNGGVMFYTVVEAEFDLIAAADGSKHTVRTFGEAMDSSDKSTNKAMSAAFKYAAMQAFCIPTEGDNDADAASHDLAPRKADGPSAGAQFAADQLRQTKTKDEFTHFWNSQKAGLRETLTEPDFAFVIGIMREEAARFTEKAADDDAFPGDANPFAEAA